MNFKERDIQYSSPVGGQGCTLKMKSFRNKIFGLGSNYTSES